MVVVATGELPAAEWASAVELGAERVAVLPADEAWLLSRAVAAVRSPVERGWLVAVGGSCGGAGASTVAAAVALAAAPGAVLVDADPWGGGLDLLLGAERVEGLRWPELTGLRGRVAGDALLAALPEIGGVHVLAASRTARSTRSPPRPSLAVVEAARSAGRPVVVDLPRGGAAADGGSAAVLADADRALLVVPARLRAATAARLLVDAPGSAWSAAQLVVRPVPGGLVPGGRRRGGGPAGGRRPPVRPQRRAPRRTRRAAGRLAPLPARRPGPPGAGRAAGPVTAPPAWSTACAPGWPSSPACRRSAGVAALVREEAGGLLGDDDVLRAVRVAVDELAGAGPLEPLLRLPGVTDVLVNGPDQVWVDPGRGSSAPTCGSRTTTRSAGWPSGSRPRPDGGSTTPRPGWTPACPTAPGCTPCSRRCRDPAPACRCGSSGGASQSSTSSPRSAPSPGPAASCCARWSGAGWRSS